MGLSLYHWRVHLRAAGLTWQWTWRCVAHGRGSLAWHGDGGTSFEDMLCSYLFTELLTYNGLYIFVYIILYNTHYNIWISHITFLHFPVLWLYIQYMDISWYSLYLWMNFLLPVFARLFVESSRIVSTAMRFRGPTSFWAAGSLGIHSYLYWLSRCPSRMIDVVRENRCSRWE
jgi:hypothetical protein